MIVTNYLLVQNNISWNYDIIHHPDPIDQVVIITGIHFIICSSVFSNYYVVLWTLLDTLSKKRQR